MDTLEQISPHASDYRPDAWREYTLEELQWWERLLTKRAGMRTDLEKRDKDLYDAANYRAMREAREAE